jgi:signal transduction histidine kinase
MAAIGKYMELRNLPEVLDNIRASGKRAATIVRNMLSFARKSDRDSSSNDVRTLLDQAVELVQTDYDMKKQYDFKKIKLIKQYDESIPLVPCDSGKLQQVFLNILKNGAEAMAETANDQRPSTFTLRVQDEDAWVRVEIEDNGPGIDDKVRRSIFDPFFTTKPVGMGTGLGLSVSYFIVTEDHSGELGAYPADSGGTRFVIRLPKAGKQS